MPPRQLGKADARVLGRCWHANCGEHVLRPERSLEQAREKIRSLNGALAFGPKGKRTIKATDFFTGLFETALGPQDVLTAIRVPAATKDTRVGFAELARRHGDYAIVGLAASARADDKGLADVRLSFFGVGATPVRARKAEAALTSGNIEDAVAALEL